MSAEHFEITVVTAEPFGDRLFVYFSDGTTTLFHSRFLYEVREHNGNIALTNLSDEELMKGIASDK
jgi:hypothetical protein